MKIFAKNYRGFDWLEVDLEKVNFLVGDNSSGKSSIIYLIDAISKTDLNEVPRLDEDFGVGEFDYFSPYRNFADVTFGYSDGDKFTKIVTVHRQKKSYPFVCRCSYIAAGKLVSFRWRQDRIEAKISDIEYSDNQSALDEHFKNTGYRAVELEERLPLSNPSLILTSFSDEITLDSRKVFRATYESSLKVTRVISPTRALPERFYRFRRKYNAHGLHFAALWMDFISPDDTPNLNEIEIFGRESSLFDRIKVRRVADKIDDSPLMVSVEKSGKEFLLNQVGVGVSQVVPVLIETLYSRITGDTSVLMQQPELHLHPIAQAALGSYLFKASTKGLRPVIETHSSFLMDRFRADLRDSMSGSSNEDGLHREEINIIFCRNSSSGNTAVDISIDSDGSLDGAPDDYHSFFVDELVRTML